MTSAAATADRRRPGIHAARFGRRHGWTLGTYVLLLGLVLYWRTVPPVWGSFDVQSLAIDALPFAFAAMAQAVVIISGGIDLSVGSLMSLVNVISAKYMATMSFRDALLFAGALALGAALAGASTGSLITISRVPDIVVTLAMLFVWAGLALQIQPIPGGGAPLKYVQLATGQWFSPWIPSGLVILLCAFVLIWLPLRRARPGLALYSIGSNRNAAYLSGVSVTRTRIFAYSLGNEIRSDIVRWHGPRAVSRFLAELYDIGKEIDPAGLFTYSNYPTTEYLDLDFLDFVSFNVYLHREEDFRRYLTHVMASAGERIVTSRV